MCFFTRLDYISEGFDIVVKNNGNQNYEITEIDTNECDIVIIPSDIFGKYSSVM